MKRVASLMLAAALALPMTSAFALNYTATLGNEATFETMTEVRANEAAAMQPFYARGTYVAHPIMADYPGDTTYVYRSPDMYGINAAVRINTNLLVFVEQNFESKDAALDYLKAMGVIDIVDAARGSVILVTPANGEKFTMADQQNYYKLQTALFQINGTGKDAEGNAVTFADASYYGGFGYVYAIGIDGGATFVNNYIASSFDFASRIGGMLLINGKMDRIRQVATFVPAMLVNTDDAIVAKYEKANGTSDIKNVGDIQMSYNSQFPVRKVATLKVDDVDLGKLVPDAYYNFLIKAQRGQEMEEGLFTAGNPYQGNTNDCVPYSLSERNALINGKTVDGIYEFTCTSEEFSDVKTDAGEYLQTWFEYLPEEIVNGTAAPGSIPMIFACHGGGDDPRQFVQGQGFLELAGKERIAIIAPEKQNLHVNDTEGDDFMSKVMPRLVKLALEKYPAIDPSRVYVTGYSMGSLATIRTAYGAPELFAGAYAQAGFRGTIPTDEDKAKFVDVDLPITISTTEYNMAYAATLAPSVTDLMSALLELNEMDPLPAQDFSIDPISGFKADIYTRKLSNGEYNVHTWLMKNDAGIPMVGAAYIECINHCLYPQHANIIWDFFKHYSRNQETGEIVYNPYN